jgi:phosphate transport system substrate-binding protein
MHKIASLVAVAIAAYALPAFAAQLEISGSTTVQKRIFENSAAPLQTATGIDVKFLPVGSGKGLVALVAGKVSVAASSETLHETVEAAKKVAKEMEKPFSPPSTLVFTEITRDTIVVIVHKDNPVASLTKEQVKDINTGKITNWKEVGGPDLPIKVITSSPGSGTRSAFQKLAMDGAEYVAGIAEIRTTKEELNEVAKDKGAIGAVSEAFFAANQGKSRIVKTPEFSRPLGLITIGQPNADVQKLIEFFKTPEGQKSIL